MVFLCHRVCFCSRYDANRNAVCALAFSERQSTHGCKRCVYLRLRSCQAHEHGSSKNKKQQKIISVRDKGTLSTYYGMILVMSARLNRSMNPNPFHTTNLDYLLILLVLGYV